VLDVESGGGRVDTKEEIVLAILTGTANGQRFAAVIRDAGSAAALISMACPEWLSFPGARVGAAVTIQSSEEGTVSFKKLLSTDPELMMKYESFSDALDKEAALATHRSPAISAAMKSSEAELWWDKAGGFSATKNGEDSECLDGAKSVLTLTHTQLVTTGLAQQILLIEKLPHALGVAESKPVIHVDRPMRATVRQLKELKTRYEEASPSEQQEIIQRANQIFERP
jgi:membrane-bound ClpP family serine protease